MSKKEKEKLNRLFDEGNMEEIPEELAASFRKDGEIDRYYNRLKQMNHALTKIPQPDVPAGFTELVMSRLPNAKMVLSKVSRIRDLLMLAVIVVSLVVSFVFADALGLSTAVNSLSEVNLQSSNIDNSLIFLLVSGVGILLAGWLIVTGFFGIRSRRYTA